MLAAAARGQYPDPVLLETRPKGVIDIPARGGSMLVRTDPPAESRIKRDAIALRLVPDHRVLIRGRRGRISREPRVTAEVGPDNVRLARRTDRDAGVVADEAARELDVRIGRLRAHARLAGIAIGRAANGVIETDRDSKRVRVVDGRRSGIAR